MRVMLDGRNVTPQSLLRAARKTQVYTRIYITYMYGRAYIVSMVVHVLMLLRPDVRRPRLRAQFVRVCNMSNM